MVVCIYGQLFSFAGGHLYSWAVCVVCCWQCHCAVVIVTSMVGGGGKKRVAMFGKYDCQTNIICCLSQIINK